MDNFFTSNDTDTTFNNPVTRTIGAVVGVGVVVGVGYYGYKAISGGSAAAVPALAQAAGSAAQAAGKAAMSAAELTHALIASI